MTLFLMIGGGLVLLILLGYMLAAGPRVMDREAAEEAKRESFEEIQRALQKPPKTLEEKEKEEEAAEKYLE